MKKIVTLSFTLALVLVSVKSFTYRSGGVQGYTNAPSEGNCVSCHSGTSLNGGSGSLSDFTLTDAGGGSGYKPDSTYTLKLKYKQTSISRFGFSITALDDSAKEPAGTFTITSNRTQKRTKTYSGKSRQYVEHTNAGTATTSTNTSEWEFKWKAPSKNVGPINFYATVNATNANGRNTGDQIYAKVFTWKLDGTPEATATTNDTIVCPNETVSFKGSGTNTPTAYSWTFPDGSPSVSTKQNPSTVYSGFGNKIAILRVQNAVGWSAPDTVNIKVLQAPTAFIQGAKTYTICPGDSVQLTANFNAKYSYTWSTGYTGGNIIHAKDTGTYFVTVKSGDCSRISNVITVKHFAVPTLSITSSNTDDSICNGGLITLNASTGFDSITWYDNKTEISTTSANTINVNVSAGSTFEARGWTSNGCLSEYSNDITYMVVGKDSAPKVSCTNREPFSVTFDWAGIATHKGVQVSDDEGKTWNTPSTGSQGTSHKLIGLNPEEDYEIWVRAITDAPCFYSEVTKQVCRTGKCSPLEATIQVDTNICKGDEVDVTINGLANEHYSLAFEGGGSFTDTSFKFSPQNEGNYTIYVTDSSFYRLPT